MDFEKAQIDLTHRFQNDNNLDAATAAAVAAAANGDDSEAIPELKITSIECLGANLQLMFTLMKESIRRSIDPSFLIKAIGLDKNIQQVS
jgi:hypothetical protein